ncbi:shikimate dehydrogenase [Rhodoplanes sp. TEM]|uniref:Shikimate dehydrogenase (NADP(+)) n=1 Tax=Rhodoplanes tepidamans TaxID=200616 RepID=A0ABT5JFU3_RHOTP|nr:MULTISPECIES: shikimate dehydrogenase [Rhodoplanes]MDC7788486.1 shikimate dehydrogenase [Rhodoplanes tepidamans]MDC7984140.1 shikimate dehydrogenase [Rhodoplanes sp. TEM]MDQ0356880.1 shikimate dehydrogenase [Rhodoplanes tepidamans]
MTDSTSGMRAACVIGWPAAHSRSPLIHRHWLETYGIAGDYRVEEVPPEAFAAFVKDLAGHGYVGANVTLPHKEAALALAVPDERAKKIGAANTLWLDGAKLRATNTDAEGFIANLDASAPKWDRGLETALVLGAGGSARAVVYGLLDRGVSRIYVANRTLARGEELARRFGAAVHAIQWDEARGLFGATQLLVNTTTLGMVGHPTLDIGLGRLPANAVVADLVYAPLETALLAAARERGLRRADGLGMLLHQAVRGFALWFGTTPEVTPELRRLVEADLLGAAVPAAKSAAGGAG